MDLKLAPLNGHCLLLMQTQEGEKTVKTFSDHPNVELCLDSLLAIYEDSPGRDEQYTLETIWKWLDQFNKITLFVFYEELARYKKLKHSELKELFISAIQKQLEPKRQKQPNGILMSDSNNTNRNQQNHIPTNTNGTTKTNSSFRDRFNDDNDVDEEEDWD